MASPPRPRRENRTVARANWAIVLAFAWLWLTPLWVFWSTVWGFTRTPADPAAQLAPPLGWLLAAIALCLAPCVLPTAYYAPWEGLRATRLYERLGLRVFRRFVTNGDLVNRWGRRRDSTYRVVRDRASAEAWAREAREAERNHLVFLLLGLCTTAHAVSIGWMGWALALTTGNLVFNAFPIALQRYNRLRIARLAARSKQATGQTLELAWATDVHLDFVDEDRAALFCAEISSSPARALLLGGDIAEARSLEHWLTWLRDRLAIPVYFVLGNHDYFGGSIEPVRALARSLTSETLAWLPTAGVVRLGERCALVGHDGWGDARLGDFERSPVVLNDYVVIADLVEAAGRDVAAEDPLAAWELKSDLKHKLAALGDDAAQTLRPHLLAALDGFEQVVVLTHVPPFREACWHQGRISNDDWLPGFTCKAMGDMLIETVSRRPDRQVTVLCGHTHGEGEAWPLPNLRVRTGRAAYGEPRFELLELPGEPSTGIDDEGEAGT